MLRRCVSRVVLGEFTFEKYTLFGKTWSLKAVQRQGHSDFVSTDYFVTQQQHQESRIPGVRIRMKILIIVIIIINIFIKNHHNPMSSSKSSIICIRRTTTVNPDWSFMQLGCWLIWAGCTACGFLKTKIIFFFHIFYIVQVGWLVAAVAGGKVCFVTLKTNWPKKSFVVFSDFHNSIEFEINSIGAPPFRSNP